MSVEETPIVIRALLIEGDDGWWSAQCLEHDIAAQAKGLSELNYELGRVLMAQILLSKEAGKEPFEGINPAPKKYWDMYEKSGLTVTANSTRLTVEPPPSYDFPIPMPQLRIAESHAA